MVSHEIAKRALSRILRQATSDENGDDDILESFHLVAWYTESYMSEPPLLYMCLGREDIIFLGLNSLQEAIVGMSGDIENGEITMNDDIFSEIFQTVKFSYECITMIKVHARAEDRFGLVFDMNHPDCPIHLGPVMHLSSIYRKDVVSAIQMQHDSYIIMTQGRLSELRIQFVGADTSDPRMAFRHPAVKMFSKLPMELAKDNEGRPKKVFFRRGYMFLLPRHVIDTYELMAERPSSTYIFRPDDGTHKGTSKSDLKADREQHLLVQFLPEKPISVASRDSELEFQLWTESVAFAVAEEQFQKHRTSDEPYDSHAYNDTFFIPSRGVHRKKLNVVGDDTKWHCFRLQIRTKFREIGVIGVRRMYLPPRIDTYQDMIFVMYGPLMTETEEYDVDPNFMQVLDEMVDSLSPASAALQTRTKSSNTVQNKSIRYRSHPTYYDRLLIQVRANALFFNHDAYSWLQFKPELGIVPRTLFIDMQCNLLASIFCKSIFKLFPKTHSSGNRLSGGDNNEEDGYDRERDDGVAAVADPLSIIFRTESRDDEAINSPEIQADWSQRISRYFAFCVDGGWSRAHLTIKHLTQVAAWNAEDTRDTVYAVSTEAIATIDRVIDFILCIVPAGMNKYVFTDNIVYKLRMCQTDTGEIDPNFTLNEWVMLRLLETSYLENLIARVSREDLSDQADGESSYLLAFLLKALLSKSHDLDLIRGVCQKISRLISNRDRTIDSVELAVKPLLSPLIELVQRGNLYVKTYAMHALYALARSDDGELIVKDVNDPVPLCVQIIKETKFPELLIATLRFLVALYSSISKYVDEEDNPIQKPQVVSMLVDMMGKRMNTRERHAPALLEEVAKLLLHLSSNELARDIMLAAEQDVVGKLMDITREHDSYAGQLEVFTKCLTNLFIQAKDHESMFNHGIVAENALEYCVALSETLSDVTSKNKVKVTLYVLTVLRQLIRMDLPQKLAEKSARLYSPTDKGVRAFNKDCERRFKILKTLATTDVAFDQVLKTVSDSLKRWTDDFKKMDLTVAGSEGMSAQEIVLAREQRTRKLLQEKAEREKDIGMIRFTVKWFRNMIRKAKEQKWNYKAYEAYEASDKKENED